MENSQNLGAILRRNAAAFSPVFATDLNADTVCQLDFTEANPLLHTTDLRDTNAFNKAVQVLLRQQGATIGVGGYLEHRFIYSRSAHFDVQAKSRNLHLGIDVWVEAGTPVYTPLEATVHSFQDNANFGDYGPTIILEHELEGVPFYTLYGHLTRTSLQGLQVGKSFGKGQKIADVGPFPENGDWPPHLHFQVIQSMEGKYGDFPGVATLAEKDRYNQLCPDPNLILQCRHLVA
ncbi:peptidoglycan DD-metalloendopeptidase family protein [Pontibacter liquoris]|uniref:peptidoglycan DD-metalloendopeptidase family protein n=1 Tax=Pontibacter liquoris TaxID=2905677 RepID=UPI001FA7FDAB|nr:peptidoglycan DD-metalloendopeptidase family protein [Pontibacter liquoris]